MANAYDVCVIGGLGHIGLPLGISLAQTGMKVAAYDINEKAVQTISAGKIPFMEQGADEVLAKVLNNTFFVSNDKNVIRQAHYVVVVIGTPVDEYLNPQYRIFLDFFDGLMQDIVDGQHIVLRSTVYPGTTENVCAYLKKHNKNVRLSFCPERLAEGKGMEELRTLPQIISAFDETSFEEAEKLFKHLTKDVLRLTPPEAELAKLFTNSWRYIMFATANQFYQLAASHNLDFYKIYDALTFNYPRAKAFPKAGFAAGPCLFKDTMQLSSFSNNNFFLGHSAMLLNEGLPNFVISQLQSKIDLKTKTVGILGMAFKANIDDKRESLSYKLKKILTVEAAQVLCHDVYIKDADFVTTDELLKKCDILIVGTPHKEYSELKIPEHIHLVDIWNFYNKGGKIL
ncbi:MAG: nucleotide sugar dehydrogenase [Candidatus Omnitrophica bacterium]|nr:nucleotide sugar dehydrogenase [Candidatus Omnitrophota bacterium]